VALVVLVLGSVRPVSWVATALAAVAIVAGIVRAYFTLREVRSLSRSRVEAVTDYLTGLANRRRLMSDLDDVFRTGERTSLLLFDLDGFKAYNDRFGHVQGDLLLARLGGKLALSVDSDGRAYRLGGDEFCVLVPGEDEVPERAAEFAAALSETGRGFRIGCASGWALLPAEAGNASAALRLADLRMYAQKNGRPEAAKRQAAGVALGILTAQQPALERHVGVVAKLAVGVGRGLGMELDDLDDLARAAELHDIGKVAIPASILEKPDALDEEEWQHVRRHTVVGERMLAAAPSLERVAKIVRSTHERFDGAGYPDGLAGEEIPVAARIIAVCDAFDAMTSHRAYRPTRSAAEAAAELERCAGEQFDPVVVEAFLPLLAAETGDVDALPRAS
jgi:diguanylate cyclase (GGDEF)-like protein